MNFGQALEEMKNNKLVQRTGWNGKNMHVYLEDMFRFPINGGIYAGSKRTYEPVFVMFTAHKTHQAGWVPSQADMLAEDWQVIDAMKG